MQKVEIRLEGCLDRHWEEWFEGVAIRLNGNGDTIMAGNVVDQAALFGLIGKLRDLGVTILAISFNDQEDDEPNC
jgi:hypothetical protein